MSSEEVDVEFERIMASTQFEEINRNLTLPLSAATIGLYSERILSNAEALSDVVQLREPLSEVYEELVRKAESQDSVGD